MTITADRTPTRNPALVVNRDTAVALGLAVVLTGTSYVLAFALGWITEADPLEAFAVATSYACTYLCVRQRRFNYPIGALSTAAYCLLFWQQGLLASAALNAYLTPMLVYGWFRWRADAETRPVTRLALRWLPVYILVAAAAYGGALLILQALGGQQAPADGFILVGTIIAQLLLDNKKVETWVAWALVNVVAIVVYFSSGLAIVGVQYVFFLGNAVYGFWMWRRAMRDGVPVA